MTAPPSHPQPGAAPLGPAAPFFIVADVPRALRHYEAKLGFEVRYAGPQPDDVFFGLVGRGRAQICLKAVAPEVAALPNSQRHAWAFWDAYIDCDDPDGLAQEFADRGATIHRALTTRDDGLRGIEVRDLDGYVLFFGKPV